MNQSSTLDPNQQMTPSSLEEQAAPRPRVDTTPIDDAMGMLESKAAETQQLGQNLAGQEQHAADKTARAGTNVANVEAEQAEAQQPNYEDAVRAAQAHSAALQQSIVVRQKMTDQLGALDTMSNQLASQKLQDSFATAGLGSQLFAIGAQMFGAFVSGVQGGPNIPAQMIEQKVRQDLDIQKYNLLHNQQAFENKKGMLHQMMAVYNDIDTAQAAAYTASINAIQKRNELTAQQYKSPKIRAAAEQANAALGQTAVKDQAALQTHFQGMQNELLTHDANLAVAKVNAEMAGQKAASKTTKQPNELKNFNGAIQNPTLFKEAANLDSDTAATIQDLQGLRDLAKGPGGISAVFNAAAQNALAFGNIRKLLGTGAALSAEEKTMAEALSGGPSMMLRFQSMTGKLSPQVLETRLRNIQKALAVNAATKITNLQKGLSLDPSSPYQQLINEK